MAITAIYTKFNDNEVSKRKKVIKEVVEELNYNLNTAYEGGRIDLDFFSKVFSANIRFDVILALIDLLEEWKKDYPFHKMIDTTITLTETEEKECRRIFKSFQIEIERFKLTYEQWKLLKTSHHFANLDPLIGQMQDNLLVCLKNFKYMMQVDVCFIEYIFDNNIFDYEPSVLLV